MNPTTYKDAGVDLDVYRQAMARLPPLLARTHSPRVIRLDGGFAGLYQLDFTGPLFSRKYAEPVLVSCTDGVGTKLKVAVRAGVHDTVGIDLVAMSVNDALCCGAEPLFFLDYVAMSRDDPELLEQLLRGVTAGCLQSDCALLGGETAILPDLYAPGDYDLAGFCVGVVERRRVIDGSAIAEGDSVLALASSGLHSNGFSLVRKVVFEMAGLSVRDSIDELGSTVGEALLTPTRIYAQPLRKLFHHYRVKSVVHGIAHITGGGLHENLARILPEGARAILARGSWPIPPVFPWLKRLGGIDDDEMDRVFNMGVGMVLVVAPYYAESIAGQLAASGVSTVPIGRIVAGSKGVAWA
jgi:phosphoribosylformylglycinamidine cyclo-ligase